MLGDPVTEIRMILTTPFCPYAGVDDPAGRRTPPRRPRATRSRSRCSPSAGIRGRRPDLVSDSTGRPSRVRIAGSAVATGKGDDGTTGLLFGGRIAKDDARAEAYGTIDEAVASSVSPGPSIVPWRPVADCPTPWPVSVRRCWRCSGNSPWPGPGRWPPTRTPGTACGTARRAWIADAERPRGSPARGGGAGRHASRVHLSPAPPACRPPWR